LRDDRSPHRLDKAPANRKTQPGSGLAAVGPSATIEFFENAFQIGGSYTRPLVGHGDDDLAALASRVNNGPGGSSILVRVVEQIKQNLAEKIGVAANGRQTGRQTDRGLLVRKDFFAADDSGAHHFADIDEIAAWRERSRLDSRHIEQIGDEAGETTSLLLDRGEKVELVRGRQLVAELLEARNRSRDRRERRSQIVGERGQKRRAQLLVFSERRRLHRFIGQQ